MRLYVIAGEASGDLHGSNLIRALHAEQTGITVRCWGGDMMEEAGAEVVKHYRELAFMGFAEVVMNLRTILGNIRLCKDDLAAYRPDAVILIDYPGFNLRIAKWCREHNIPVLYYISPQIWAWKESRVKAIKRDVTRMFVILPFEKAFYARHGMEVEFVGHPLLDVVAASTDSRSESGQKRVLLLPGSRKQEIRTMLPVMLKAVQRRKDCEYVIAGAPGQQAALYHEVAQTNDLPLVFGQTYDLMKTCHAALVTSGTATLEAALHRVPMAVCYKGSTVSYAIARRLVKVKYISLVNLILDREAVLELIQSDMNVDRVCAVLGNLLDDPAYRGKQLREFAELSAQLGGGGASIRAARAMLKTLSTRTDGHNAVR